MPTAPPHPCRAPRCRALIATGAWCAAHQPREERPSAARRGYDRTWRGKWRRTILEREPLCRVCAARGLVVAATDVDHLVPRADGGAESVANLQPLCHACHSAKTRREMGSGVGLSAARPTRRSK
jgi:5-methylcytosine-specific restriction protein A